MDSDGNIMRCHECDSTKHFTSDCPHRKVEERNMTVHITLVTGKADPGTGSMLDESLGKGILDSACTKTIPAEEWMNECLENLNEEDKKEVLCCETESKSLFRFIDDVESKSTIKTVNIRIVISSKKMLLELGLLSNEEKQKKAIKLHCQLCHASIDWLVKLSKDSGCDYKKVLKMIVDCCDNCEFYSKFKKPFLRPVVRFPVLDRFNEYVSMDLKEIEKGKVWIPDAATRYTAACLIRRKKRFNCVLYISDMGCLFWNTW